MAPNQIHEQRQKLQTVAKQLKLEFIGLEKIIDQVIEGVMAWACVPGVQERPTIISLWGLTGVGKSSLVRRLVELMQWSDRLTVFDCGELKSSNNLSERLLHFAHDEKLNAPIFLLDEFQRGFTVEEGKEVYGDGLLWDWLDTGVMWDLSHISQLSNAYADVRKLRQCLEMGIGVKDGKVQGDVKLFRSITEDRDYDFFEELMVGKNSRSIERKPFFVRFRIYEYLSDYNPRKWKTAFAVSQHTQGMTGVEIVDFLEREITELLVPQKIDTRAALVFVAGNLDDAYDMAMDVDVDSDADVLQARSRLIGLPEIKEALLKRYRPEQIARLGNRHIIYPAFGRSEYQQIIAAQVNKVLGKFSSKLHLAFEVDASLLDIIYSEGVAPAQGVRPVLSTVDQLVTNRIPTIYLAVQELGESVNRVKMLGHSSGRLVTEFHRAGQVVGEHVDQVLLQNQVARADKTPATKAAISVHEAGHALVQVLRTGKVPTTLTCVTANRNVLGYAATRTEKSVVLRTALDDAHELEVLYGGIAAEEVVFGVSLVTAGSGEDIMRATRIAGLKVKKRGQGSVRYHADPMASDCDWSIKGDDAQLDREVANFLQQAHQNAVQLLSEYQHALVGLAHELFKHGTLREDEIKAYLTQELGLELPAQAPTAFDQMLLERHQALNLLRQVG
jgi:cell division protease FtsH